MKLASVVLFGLGALILVGCSSTLPPEKIVYEATNPARIVVETDGVQYVYLTEGPAYFAEDSIQIKEGTVVFYVTNEADQDVTFTVCPFGFHDEESTLFRLNVPRGRTATIRVELEPGYYEYCCPVNGTEWYPLEVIAQQEPAQE